jgi:hypothetical protein
MLDKNTFNKISIIPKSQVNIIVAPGEQEPIYAWSLLMFWSGSSAYGRKTNTQKSGGTDGEGHHNALGPRELAQGTKRSKVKIQRDIYRRRIKWTLS